MILPVYDIFQYKNERSTVNQKIYETINFRVRGDSSAYTEQNCWHLWVTSVSSQ